MVIDNIRELLQGFTLVIISFSVYAVSKNLIEVKKNISKLESGRKIKPTTFEKDSLYLNHLIDNHFEYFVRMHTETLRNRYQDSLLRDDDIEELATDIVIDIMREMSDEYIELMEYYISDMEYYVSSRIMEKITPFVVSLNVAKLK